MHGLSIYFTKNRHWITSFKCLLQHALYIYDLKNSGLQGALICNFKNKFILFFDSILIDIKTLSLRYVSYLLKYNL